MQQFKIHEAKTHFSQLIRLVMAGEEVVILKGQKPVARVTPFVVARPQRQVGGARGLIALADDFQAPLEDFQDYC